MWHHVAMKLLVTGGSSFVGAHFCVRAARNHDVLALHHTTPLMLNGITPIKADLRTLRDRRRVSALDFDAVIHLATKVKGKDAVDVNRTMMDAVLGWGCPTVYASSTVVHWSRSTPYGESRKEDEKRLAESGLPWAVLRPSAPYGRALINHDPGHKESFHTLAEWVRSSPVVPVIGDGQYRRQPIHVDDFSDAILRLLESPLPNRAFDAGGLNALSFNEIIDVIAAAMNTRARKIHLPQSLFVQMARFHQEFDADLIRAVDEDEVADSIELMKETGIRCRPFSEGVRCLI
jgi:nucleoside-diphosphate-sugar epimerase